MVQILRDIYSDIELANCLGFKGGTALMFFYDMPRFSVDLDFNLLDNDKEDVVYEKVRNIILKYGTIFDDAKKFYGPLIVLDYGKNERKLKVEISKRSFINRYEIKNLLGINLKVMVLADMLSHKLCALLDRNTIISRDIFDSWFLMEKQAPVNKEIIETRMGMDLAEYFQKCIDQVESLNSNRMMSGMGDLLDPELKTFVRSKLQTEFIGLLKFYRDYPIF